MWPLGRRAVMCNGACIYLVFQFTNGSQKYVSGYYCLDTLSHNLKKNNVVNLLFGNILNIFAIGSFLDGRCL